MAQCKQPTQEFIKNSFTPQVAVMCSDVVQQLCKKNNLSFIELCQPFCKLSSDVHYRDPNGFVTTVHNLKISFLDVSSRPPQPTLARKYLNSAVTDASEPRTQSIQIGEYNLETPVNTPWFEAWRETFLQVQYPSDHEYTKHFLACILAVSSLDTDPIETLIALAQSLNQMQVVSPNKLPKWFNSNILRYYLLVHDSYDGKERIALETFDAMKTSYGASNCFLLRMNSRPVGQCDTQLPDPWSQFLSNRIDYSSERKTPENSPLSTRVNALEVGEEASESGNILSYHPLSPDIDDNLYETLTEEEGGRKKSLNNKPHGCCLSTNDVEEIKLFMYEFCTHALLPYIERQMQQLTDIVSNKKGVSRSLFSATKRWFAPNKPGATVPVNNLVYSNDSPELQMRRLGDLYFMFGNYSLAYQVYHSAKRDFNADQAWLYYAGALEMAALSAFMADEANRKTFDYMEESITTYLNTCKMAQFATRATLLSTECLKSKAMYGEAAHQLIRMTSEESDLRSALLLEQAAYCFLHSKPSMIRKYAFHMVLAGHRFSKAAQRKHSLRSYKQAYQVYQRKGWNLAEDHIHYTIGRQANNLNQLEEAVKSFAELLSGRSKQAAQQQALFLKEYLTIHSTLQQTCKDRKMDVLPLPVLENESIRILVGPTPPLTMPGRIPATGLTLSRNDGSTASKSWIKLEEMLVQEAQGSLPLIFKPAISLYNVEDIARVKAIAIANEPIQVSIKICNNLHIILNLKNIHLLWEFETSNSTVDNETETNTAEECVKTHFIKTVIMQAVSTHELILTITPLVVGKLTMKGVCYDLMSSYSQDDVISVRGKQPFDVSKLKKDKVQIEVVTSAPCLQVSFSEICSDVLCNELQKVTVDLRNASTIALHKIHIATSVPDLLSTCEFDGSAKPSMPNNFENAAVKERWTRRQHVTEIPLPHGQLEPGKCHSVNLWLRAPDQKGAATIDLLLYYENVDSKSIPRYRLIRHVWKLSVQESISMEATYSHSSVSSSVEQLAVTVKVTNLNKVHNTIITEVSPLKAGIYSCQWCLVDSVLTPKDVCLSSQETVHFVLKCKRKVQEKDSYSQVSLFKDNRAPNTDKAYLSFIEISNRQQTLNDLENEQKFTKPEGTLMLIWQAVVLDAGKKRMAYGQSLLSIQRNIKEQFKQKDHSEVVFLDEMTVEPQSITANNRLTEKAIFFNLKHPGVVRHNFKKVKVCIVHLQLLLHSITDTENLCVTVNTIGTSSGSGSPANGPVWFNPKPSSHFRWIGKASTKRVMKPYSSDVLDLSIAILAPGTYDLGARIDIWCHVGDDSDNAVLQTNRMESALIVINEDN